MGPTKVLMMDILSVGLTRNVDGCACRCKRISVAMIGT